jgi:hypothetical protein
MATMNTAQIPKGFDRPFIKKQPIQFIVRLFFYGLNVARKPYFHKRTPQFIW